MRKLDEKREVLYVIRAMDVLMSSGIGLEATVHSISCLLYTSPSPRDQCLSRMPSSA